MNNYTNYQKEKSIQLNNMKNADTGLKFTLVCEPAAPFRVQSTTHPKGFPSGVSIPINA